jgi:hypothetical protein
MAQATWADELAGVAPQIKKEDEDLWHVAVAPGEVKILSLEQVDDLYRLEIIDDSTLVWQPGMSGWLPLSVVAGDDDDDEPATTLPVHSIPPPPSRLPAPPPPSLRAAPPSRPAPPPRPTPPPSRPAPAPSVRPAPVVTLPVPSRPPVALATTDAFGLVAQPAPLSRPPVRIEPLVPTLRPLAFDPTPSFQPAPRARSGGGSLIFLAALAGLVVTLYRNDVLRSAARSAGVESTYLKLEGALGGPSFGTPRAVEELRPSVTAAAATSLAVASPSTTSDSSKSASTSSTSSTSQKSDASAVSLDSLPVESKKTIEPAKVAAPEAKSTTAAPSKAAAPAKIEEPEPKGPLTLDEAIRKASGTKSKPAAANAKSSFTSAPKSAPRRKGGASDYDPMNGKL